LANHGRSCTGRSSAIDLAPIADAQYPDDDAPVLEVANDPPVADAIFPVIAKLCSGKRLAQVTRVLQFRDAFFEKPDQPELYRSIELLQVLDGIRTASGSDSIS